MLIGSTSRRWVVSALIAFSLASCSGSSGHAGPTAAAPSSTASASGELLPTGSSADVTSSSEVSAESSSEPTGRTAQGDAAGSPSRTIMATGAAGATGAGAPVPWDTGLATVGAPRPTAPASAPSGQARLSILLDDGFGARTTWTLTCDPVGGTHPTPASACGVLGAHGASALPAATVATCPQDFAGPQKARITGTWRGHRVDAELSLDDGCEIKRWTALLGLLPPGGVT